MLPEVTTNTKLGAWGNQVNKELRKNSTGGSSNTLHNTYHNGTIIKTKVSAGINPILLTIPLAYDAEEAYGVGDIVYITDELNPAGYNIFSGIWMCIKNVPSNKFANESGVPTEWKRTSGINYYPRWPMPTNSPEDVNVWFWMLISLYPTVMTVCENRVNHQYYVAAYEKSGSLA